LLQRNQSSGHLIAFGDQTGIMTLLVLDFRFGFEDALQQNGILCDQASFLDLQYLDQRSLLGEFVFPGCQLLGEDLAIAGAVQLFDGRPMVE
jgi:hypothetical protein